MFVKKTFKIYNKFFSILLTYLGKHKAELKDKVNEYVFKDLLDNKDLKKIDKNKLMKRIIKKIN